MIRKRLLIVFSISILIYCSIFFPDRFTIDQNIGGKTVFYEPYGYYVQNNNQKLPLRVQHGTHFCTVFDVSQNETKSLCALVVGRRLTRFELIINLISKQTSPVYCLLLISGDRILYSKKLKPPISMEWISENELLVDESNKQFILNERGKIKKVN